MNGFLSPLLVVFIAFAVPALAAAGETPSLFFTGEEAQHIEQMNTEKTPQAAADIHLGAVMYYGPGNWTVWLQGTRWTPETSRDGLRIVSVTPDKVRLSVDNGPTAAPRDVVLKPHQTYRLATGEVVEGKR